MATQVPANKVSLTQRRLWRKRFDPLLDAQIKLDEELAVLVYHAVEAGLTLNVVGDMAGGMSNITVRKWHARGEAILKERSNR